MYNNLGAVLLVGLVETVGRAVAFEEGRDAFEGIATGMLEGLTEIA